MVLLASGLLSGAGIQAASAMPVLLVTAGSICGASQEGQSGIGSSGKTYVCQSDGAGKLRWL